MMGIDDIFIGFVISYITGQIPSLKELFKKEEDNSVQEHINKCYEKALKKWCANDSIRQRVARLKFSDVNQLSDFATNYEGADALALMDLSKLWAEELRNDEKCFQYIQETHLKRISEKINCLDVYIKGLNKLGEIHQVKRGLKNHKPVENYIRRYCNSEQTENNYLYYALNLRQRHYLSEFVTGTIVTQANKFILYSSAQTGKTTELKQLCWELQQSGLYLPIMYEVRNNTQLKREHLPDSQLVEEKEVIVVIDALDEVNGKTYDDLLEEICGYAYDHPDIKIVLSCRNNYRRESQLKQFYELYLEELSYDDVRGHINNVLGNSNGLIKFISANGLADFARNPFFLNVLIDAYRDDCKQLPRNKAEVYKLFIEKSYKTETKDKNISSVNHHSFEESVRLLEKVALGLSLMNVQTLGRDELKICLDDDENNLTECLRYDLIRCEDGRYSFKHNAFREWLVANYLYREGLGRAEQLATHPNGRIKPEWYNIIMLWVSMYGKKDTAIIESIFTWLKRASLDLVIYIDKGMISEAVRDDIFKGLLLEYKSLGIRMSNILTQEYKNLLDFAQSKETVRFIIDEINDAQIGTAYYADLMCLCFFLNWNLLKLKNPELEEELFQTLLTKTEVALKGSPKHDISLLYFDIPFFANKEYLKRIFAVVSAFDHYEAVRSMLQLIGEADAADEYLDYILDKEHLVCNQHEGNTTHVVTRGSVYFALEKVKSLDGVKKVLSHEFKKTRIFYHDEWDEYSRMMKSILSRIAGFIKNGHKELANELEQYYVNIFKDYFIQYDNDKNAQDLLALIRQCYIDAGCRDRGRKQFYDELAIVFSPDYKEVENFSNLRQIFAKAALWMTCDDVKDDFDRFSATDVYDMAKAGWYREIPYAKVADCARSLYTEAFPESEAVTKRRERQKNSFNDFADYDVFKQVVLELISYLKDGMTRKEYRQQLDALDNGYNQYAYRFISNFTDRNNRYDLKGIIQGIKNHDIYEAFFMDEISRLISYSDPNIPITDELKERCVNCAKANVIKLCNGEQAYFIKVAVNFMLNGYFEVSPELLPNLLDYADYSTTIRDSNNFYSNEYSLFDYIVARVNSEEIAPLIVKKLQDNITVDNYHLANQFSKFIVENRVENGYHLALQYALSNNAWSSNILDLLVKNRVMVEEIKAAIRPLPVTEKLFVYETLVRELCDDVWVKHQLEVEYKSCSGYSLTRALRLLTSIGSLVALDYLTVNSNLIKDGDDFHFNYDNPNAISNLCFFIQFCYEKHRDEPFMLTSILASLERIAVKDEDSLNEVKMYLRGLTQKGNQYKYLNRHILLFEDKYYASYSGISNISKVIEMIETSVQMKTSTDHIAFEDKNMNVEDVVYVSYNWTGESLHIVDYFCTVLDYEKIGFKRDKRDCSYLENIKEFMNAIRAGKTVVVVFNRYYFKSRYCMYELSGIMEDPAFKDRVLPVVIDDTIRDSTFYVEIVKYWKNQLDEESELVEELKSIDPNMAKPEETKCKEIEAIYQLLPIIKEYIDWINAENLDSLSSSHFKTIIDKVKAKWNKT